MPRKLKPDSPFRYFSFWRAVNHYFEIFESFGARTRNKHAALAFLKKALTRSNNVRFRRSPIQWLPVGNPAHFPSFMAKLAYCHDWSIKRRGLAMNRQHDRLLGPSRHSPVGRIGTVQHRGHSESRVLMSAFGRNGTLKRADEDSGRFKLLTGI